MTTWVHAIIATVVFMSVTLLAYWALSKPRRIERFQSQMLVRDVLWGLVLQSDTPVDALDRAVIVRRNRNREYVPLSKLDAAIDDAIIPSTDCDAQSAPADPKERVQITFFDRSFLTEKRQDVEYHLEYACVSVDPMDVKFDDSGVLTPETASGRETIFAMRVKSALAIAAVGTPFLHRDFALFPRPSTSAAELLVSGSNMTGLPRNIKYVTLTSKDVQNTITYDLTSQVSNLVYVANVSPTKRIPGVSGKFVVADKTGGFLVKFQQGGDSVGVWVKIETGAVSFGCEGSDATAKIERAPQIGDLVLFEFRTNMCRLYVRGASVGDVSACEVPVTKRPAMFDLATQGPETDILFDLDPTTGIKDLVIVPFAMYDLSVFT